MIEGTVQLVPFGTNSVKQEKNKQRKSQIKNSGFLFIIYSFIYFIYFQQTLG